MIPSSPVSPSPLLATGSSHSRAASGEKPSTSFDHADLMTYLGLHLAARLDRSALAVHINHGRLRHGDRTYYIPDIIVIPAGLDPRAR